MTNYKTCNSCRGQKKYSPLGFMVITCDACNGTGLIEKTVGEVVTTVEVTGIAEPITIGEQNITDRLDQISNTVTNQSNKALAAQTPARRGRPPRQVIEDTRY